MWKDSKLAGPKILKQIKKGAINAIKIENVSEEQNIYKIGIIHKILFQLKIK